MSDIMNIAADRDRRQRNGATRPAVNDWIVRIADLGVQEREGTLCLPRAKE